MTEVLPPLNLPVNGGDPRNVRVSEVVQSLTVGVAANEQPLHRTVKQLIISLKAAGESNAKISAVSGWSMEDVNSLLNEDWAKVRLIREMEALGRDPVATLINSSGVDNVLTLMMLRDNPAASPQVRFSAAKELMNRQYGTPRANEAPMDGKDRKANRTIDEINQQIAALEEEARNTIGRPPVRHVAAPVMAAAETSDANRAG